MLTRTSLLVLALSGCYGELTLNDPPPGFGPADDLGENDGARADNPVARELWDSDIAPLMTVARPKGTCVTCHQGEVNVGPTFLGASPDRSYDTVRAGVLIGDSPETSRFLTIGEHTGNGFCTGAGAPVPECTDDEATIVADWLRVQIDG